MTANAGKWKANAGPLFLFIYTNARSYYYLTRLNHTGQQKANTDPWRSIQGSDAKHQPDCTMCYQFLLTLQLLVLQLPAIKGQGLLWYVLVFFNYSFTIDKQYISVQYSSDQCRTMKVNNSQQWPSVSHAIFICSCYHYFDLCSISTFSIISIPHSPSAVLLLYPMIFRTLCLSIFRLPLSVYTSIPHLLTSIFCVLSHVPLFHFYYYLSTICSLFLAFPSQPWQLIIPSLVTLWVIFLHSPYYSESCSIKFLPILYLLPSL